MLARAMWKNDGLAFSDAVGAFSHPDKLPMDKTKRPKRASEIKIICVVSENLGPSRSIKTRSPSKQKENPRFGNQ